MPRVFLKRLENTTESLAYFHRAFQALATSLTFSLSHRLSCIRNTQFRVGRKKIFRHGGGCCHWNNFSNNFMSRSFSTHAQTKLFVSPVFVEAGTRKFFCPNIFFRVARRTLDALPTSRLTFRVPKVRPSQTQSRNTAPLIYLHASLFI